MPGPVMFIYSDNVNLKLASYVAIITAEGEVRREFGGLLECERSMAQIGATVGPRIPGSRAPLFEFRSRPDPPIPKGAGRIRLRKKPSRWIAP